MNTDKPDPIERLRNKLSPFMNLAAICKAGFDKDLIQVQALVCDQDEIMKWLDVAHDLQSKISSLESDRERLLSLIEKAFTDGYYAMAGPGLTDDEMASGELPAVICWNRWLKEEESKTP